MASSGSNFGTWVRQTRQALGITQESFAYRIGCSYETVRKIEAGTRRPSQQVAELIGRTLGVPDSELISFVANARSKVSGPAPLRDPSPAATSSASRQVSTLPIPLTSFVGRGVEIKELRDLFLKGGARLVTLLGPPGIGKTRLSIELAHTLRPDFEYGPFFVPLSAISTSDLFIPTVAGALGIEEKSASGTPGNPREVLFDRLRERRTLLVLDNMEHVLHASASVAELLSACPGLQLLVTSREPLHLYGEQQYPVRPLAQAPIEEAPERDDSAEGGRRNVGSNGHSHSLPPQKTVSQAPASFEQYDAVQLFVQRAQAVERRFELTQENAYDVARICLELDGLPLAIELAAAQSKVLAPRAILARLTNRLKLLTRGSKDLPSRHQTLYAAIDWSYSLLSDEERKLLRRQSAFAGGRSLEALEAVCVLPGEDDPDVLALVSSLVDKSLLRMDMDEEGEARFFMLWTIREFGLEQLEASGEAEIIRERHVAYFTTLAENAIPSLTSPRRDSWLNLLDAELSNIRIAISWALAGTEAGAAAALRIAGALHWFWYFRGHISEGRAWLARALSAPGAESSGQQAEPNGADSDDRRAARARALHAAGKMALVQGDIATAMLQLEESVVLWRAVGDRRGLAYALTDLGGIMAFRRRKADSGGPECIEEALSLLRELGDKWGQAFALDMMGDAVGLTGGSDDELEYYKRQSLVLYRNLDDSWGVASLLTELGYITLSQGNHNEAHQLLTDALDMARRAGDRRYIAFAVMSLAQTTWEMGDPIQARLLFSESLDLYKDLGDRLGEATALRNLGHLAHREGAKQQASSYYRRSLQIAIDLESEQNLALSLVAVAGLIGALGRPDRAAQLLGASDIMRESSGGLLPPTDRIQRSYTYETLRSVLGEVRLAEEIANGKSTPLAESLQLVEANLPPSS